ncbi:DNA phosphorothioation-dependent restriction protein DptG [Acinetobacter tandoii]|uniref:DNA phosphorothioation-dependent restriction protein DptG n=1 Tax=Acinetobacter tandoii TaxID=202954 RepID=A0A5N4WK93_9GAMM|nr:DNA phosphorothioation-dependent restriction protein DptG [Acinetobacter tandoii]
MQDIVSLCDTPSYFYNNLSRVLNLYVFIFVSSATTKLSQK